MDIELVAGQDSVAIRANSIERYVAQVEQAGIADDHIEADTEEHVDQNGIDDSDMVRGQMRYEKEKSSKRPGDDQQRPNAACSTARRWTRRRTCIRSHVCIPYPLPLRSHQEIQLA